MTTTLPASDRERSRAHEECLVLRRVAVAYGRDVVFRDVSADIPRGEVVSIVGPNGSGKSTLLKAVAGLIPLAEGEITLFGAPIARVRDRIAYVPQREDVDWTFPISVREVVAMGRHAVRGWLRPPPRDGDAPAIDAALERLGIADLAGRQIGSLSGGQQRRTFIARAVAQDPDLFLLDEPMAGVDAATHDRILELFDEWRDRGKIVLQATHSDIHGGSMIVFRRRKEPIPADELHHYGGEVGPHHD